MERKTQISIDVPEKLWDAVGFVISKANEMKKNGDVASAFYDKNKKKVNLTFYGHSQKVWNLPFFDFF